jgi:hypothetical protein
MAKIVLLACPKCNVATTELSIELEGQKDREIACKACGATHSREAMIEHGDAIRRKYDKPRDSGE